MWDSWKRFKKQQPLLSELVYYAAILVAIFIFLTIIGDPDPTRLATPMLIGLTIHFLYKYTKHIDKLAGPAAVPGSDDPDDPVSHRHLPIMLPEGTFTVGTDILAGMYTITASNIGAVSIFNEDALVFSATLNPEMHVSNVTVCLEVNQKVKIECASSITFTPVDAVT